MHTTTRWVVRYYSDKRPDPHYTTQPIASPDAVRTHLEGFRGFPGADRYTITELRTLETAVPVPLTALPGPGKATALPPRPIDGTHVSAFYRFRDYGPPVLRDGDTARTWWAWAQENGNTYDYDLDKVLASLEYVTLVTRSREVQLSDLPA